MPCKHKLGHCLHGRPDRVTIAAAPSQHADLVVVTANDIFAALEIVGAPQVRHH